MRNKDKRGGKVVDYFSQWCGCLGIFILALGLTGCSTVHNHPKELQKQFSTFHITNAPPGPVTSSILQAQVMRFADTYVALVSQSCDDITAATTNADVRLAALRWKLDQGTAAYNDATGQNPPLNALDLLVLATMAKNNIQGYAVQKYGKIVDPLLKAHENMESNAWIMVSSFLSPSQETELRNLMHEWRLQHPHQHVLGPVRFTEFATALGKTPTPQSTSPGSIFSLLYLNPLAELDPTTAAIEGIRDLGDRTLYYTQRMPILLNWQTQLLAFRLAAEPAPMQMQADFSRISADMGVFANTSKQLPQIINDQRHAAIEQILDGLVAQENKSSGLLTNTRLTLEAASMAATNLNTTIQSLNTFVQYVSPRNRTPTTATAGTNSKPPFNVLDYGTAASQIGAAATNLTTLMVRANQNARQMTDDADRLMYHAFGLGMALLAGAVAAGLIYRVLANKIAGGGRKAPDAKS